MKKFFIYSLNLIIFWISKFLPKKNNLIVIGSWKGDLYNDNSKYFFEYLNEKTINKSLKVVWLTSNNNIYRFLKNKNYKVVKTYSIKGYYYSIFAKWHIIDNALNDVNLYVYKENILNLWHGIPLKKMGCSKNNKCFSIRQKIKYIIFPFLNLKSAKRFYYIASSEHEKRNLMEAFNLSSSNVIITGMPRINSFFKNKYKSKDFFKVIYMPTHRGHGKNDILKFFLSNYEKIYNFCKKNNIIFYVKLHYLHLKELEQYNVKSSKYIIFLKDEDYNYDIYNFLPMTDLLITDYSSIYFDYLYTNNPIIFFPFDYNEYEKKEGFYYDYFKVTPGPKVFSYSDLLSWIKKFKDDKELFLEERQKIFNYFHQYDPKKINENIFKIIEEVS